VAQGLPRNKLYLGEKFDFARFRMRTGKIGLDIGSAGSDIAAFEKFVQQVGRQIPR
jgi:hypothetical protein